MSRKVSDKVRVNFYADPQVCEALLRISVIQSTTVSELMRKACREFVVREYPKVVRAEEIIKGMP